MAHTLPPLPYDYMALEPHIDEQTMRIHHDKHHDAYVNNLNAALKDQPDLDKLSIEQLLGDLSRVPEAIRTAVRNNAGGHVNLPEIQVLRAGATSLRALFTKINIELPSEQGCGEFRCNDGRRRSSRFQSG